VVRSLRRAGIRDLAILVNSRGQALCESLAGAFPDLSWTFLAQDTASSWESFRLVSRALGARCKAFLVSTADALIPPAETARFAREAVKKAEKAEAALALTPHVDDERPLWAELGPDGLVRALGEGARGRHVTPWRPPLAPWRQYARSRAQHVTAGLYYLTRGLAERMPAASAYGSLREYWISLVARGARVAGIPLSKTLDVDRPRDLKEAEAFVAAGKMR